jgi:aryl sulfotransferase
MDKTTARDRAVRAPERHYQNMIFDSARWAEFTPRPGDVVVCTSYKAGTTWTQMICALLIHRTPALPAPLAELSPWLDMRLEPVSAVAAAYDAQPHRRVIKTHTPLDGLPYYDDVTYLVCGRDPRDVFMSMQNHLANGDFVRAAAMMAAQGLAVEPPPPLPDDLDERFALWMTVGTFPGERDGLPYWSHFRHAETFWARRAADNIHFLHYADLKTDLEGQMRRVADLLGVTVEADAWPGLVKAATFENMKANADHTAPDTNHQLWFSNSQFFHKGQNEQWRGALSAESLALYDQRSRDGYDGAMVDWLERGAAAGDPKGL